MSEEEAEEYYINEKVTMGDYSFDIRLKNALNLAASSLICVSILALQV